MARLPQHHSHRPFLKIELQRHAAGKRGEGRLMEKFNEFYSAAPYEILWDVQLSLGNWRVQMDGLLLTEHRAIIIESKNISGRIHFDLLTDEFYRTNLEGVKTVMDDPTVQLDKNIRFLQTWFQIQKINLPVEGIVVFTSKQCEFISKTPGKHICKTYQMNHLLYKLLEIKSSQKKTLKVNEIQNLIESNQTPFKHVPLCEHYFIDPSDLTTGVLCSECSQHSMKRVLKKWICEECGHRDPRAHHLAVQEYFALVDKEMSNLQFRQFSGIESIFVASRMLAEFDLAKSGSKKNRRYQLKSKNPPLV
ncbi:MAG TPA: nuclease-related domain-containing protein [Planococcus sp. (in: firmicutes)]|nr:nuclease-related domain-containing protein [Planococcus sp. (in: firmicutes)]